MPRYSDELLNEIFSQNDIVDYVSQYVKLKKNGRDYTGLCPFHKEKSPSFHVNQDKQLFHCFGCGIGGNLVQFVMKSEGLDFLEALKLMADRAGIILPEEDDKIDDKAYQLKKKIYLINKLTAKFYYDTLVKEECGKEGLDYYIKRGISSKTVIKYGLGYAPDRFDYLKQYLNSQGYTDGELIEAGVCVTKNGKVYDKFRGRVIFPIIDLRGNVIGFGGRIINEAEKDGFKPPKYLNSSETPVFNKGKNLFSLNLAKKASEARCILCEGYMDVISVHQSGVENIVATLGTALTENQAKLLMKYTNEIILCYDSDEAGQAATRRAISIINSVGGRCRVMKLKDAKDPDVYISKYGVDLFKKAMRDAVASTDYLLSEIRTKYNIDNPDGKIMFVQEAAEILSKITNAIEVDAYIKRISDETEISKDAIYAELKKSKASEKISDGVPKVIKHQQKQSSVQENTSIVNAEKRLIGLIIENKKNYIKVKDEFTCDDFSSDIIRRLAKMVYDAYEKGDFIEPAIMINNFLGEEADFVSKIFCNLEIYENEGNTISQLVTNIKLDKLSEEIEKASKENDVAKLRELLTKRLELEGNKRCQN